MHTHRPTGRELDKRLVEAKACLKDQKGLFANPAKAVGELYHLAVNDAGEIWKLIYELLEEIDPSDYAGTRPPQKSYEKAINNRELFAFTWMSPKMGKEMYIKFALKEGLYYYVSLHESRKIEKEEVVAKLPASEKSMILSQFAEAAMRPEPQGGVHTQKSRTPQWGDKMAQKGDFAGGGELCNYLVGDKNEMPAMRGRALRQEEGALHS